MSSTSLNTVLVTKGKTARDLLFEKHQQLTAAALQLMEVKNQDYADASDPFANFREFGRFGILVRLSDKFQRLKNYEKRGNFAVKDESATDTCLDILNYVVLYLAYPEEK